jgi:hypothetical protein
MNGGFLNFSATYWSGKMVFDVFFCERRNFFFGGMMKEKIYGLFWNGLGVGANGKLSIDHAEFGKIVV